MGECKLVTCWCVSPCVVCSSPGFGGVYGRGYKGLDVFFGLEVCVRWETVAV